MKKHVCSVCGYVYNPAKGDPENGVAHGTPFDELPRIGSAPCAVQARTCSILRIKEAT